jgi:dUTP pyrophosphatase
VLNIFHTGPIPTRATEGSAGYDIRALHNDVIVPMTRAVIPTGIFLEIPKRFEAQVRSRSGLAAKHGVFVLNSPGTIDSDYRGEIKVILFNSGTENFVITAGDRIAQLVFATVQDARFIETEITVTTQRGDGGFGSTGTH